MCETCHEVFQFKKFRLKQKNKFLWLLQICQCCVWCRIHSRSKCSSNLFCRLIAAMRPVFSLKVWAMISRPPPMKIGLQHGCHTKDDLPWILMNWFWRLSNTKKMPIAKVFTDETGSAGSFLPLRDWPTAQAWRRIDLQSLTLTRLAAPNRINDNKNPMSPKSPFFLTIKR